MGPFVCSGFHLVSGSHWSSERLIAFQTKCLPWRSRVKDKPSLSYCGFIQIDSHLGFQWSCWIVLSGWDNLSHSSLLFLHARWTFMEPANPHSELLLGVSADPLGGKNTLGRIDQDQTSHPFIGVGSRARPLCTCFTSIMSGGSCSMALCKTKFRVIISLIKPVLSKTAMVGFW